MAFNYEQSNPDYYAKLFGNVFAQEIDYRYH